MHTRFSILVKFKSRLFFHKTQLISSSGLFDREHVERDLKCWKSRHLLVYYSLPLQTRKQAQYVLSFLYLGPHCYFQAWLIQIKFKTDPPYCIRASLVSFTKAYSFAFQLRLQVRKTKWPRVINSPEQRASAGSPNSCTSQALTPRFRGHDRAGQNRSLKTFFTSVNSKLLVNIWEFTYKSDYLYNLFSGSCAHTVGNQGICLKRWLFHWHCVLNFVSTRPAACSI